MRKTVCSVSYDGDVFIRPDPIKHAPSDLNQLRLNRLGRKKKNFFFLNDLLILLGDTYDKQTNGKRPIWNTIKKSRTYCWYY